MTETIKFKALKSGTEHDGTSMIVMNEGEETVAPAGAEQMLRDRGYFKGRVKHNGDAAEVGGGDVSAELAAAIERAEIAEGKLAELEKDSGGNTADRSFELAGLTLNEKGGGHFEITGPDGFEPIKVRGVEDAKAAFLDAVVDAHTAPTEQAPAS